MRHLTREEAVGHFYAGAGIQIKSLIDEASVYRIVRAFGLIEEEFKEADADIVRILTKLRRGKPVTMELVQNLIKELADLQYVLSAFAYEFGIDLDRAFTEVHKSNLTKLDADGQPYEVDETGKIKKGPHYVPADMNGVPFEGKARCHSETLSA